MSPRFRIELPRVDYLPGEMVTGRVVVTEPGHSRRLEISLGFWEASAEAFTARPRHVRGPVLHTGTLQLDAFLPFSIRIPLDALPNATGPHGMLFWAVEAHSDEFGPDTVELAPIRVQWSQPVLEPEPRSGSAQPRIQPETSNATQLPVSGEGQLETDQGQDGASREVRIRGRYLFLFGAIGMLLWGGAAALEMYGVVAFGENASPIGKGPTITAAAIGLVILLGVPFQAVAQTPPESRVRRVPGFCWFLLIGCTLVGLFVIGVRAGLFIPIMTSLLLLFVCVITALSLKHRD